MYSKVNILNVACSCYEVSAIGKLALLMYLNECRIKSSVGLRIGNGKSSLFGAQGTS